VRGASSASGEDIARRLEHDFVAGLPAAEHQTRDRRVRRATVAASNRPMQLSAIAAQIVTTRRASAAGAKQTTQSPG
jgi:hypothetical protein